MAVKIISREELAKHSSREDAWIAVAGVVYDVSKFLNVHPGGAEVLRAVAGRDASEEFFALHRTEVLTKFARLRVGSFAAAGNAIVDGHPVDASSNSVAEGLSPDVHQQNGVPYGESPYWRGWRSPYFGESHDRFRRAIRAFVDREIRPVAIDADESGEEPSLELYEKLGKAGILALLMGPGEELCKFCKSHGVKLPGDLAPEEFDYFHSLIFTEELRRTGTYGFNDGLIAGISIGVPPIFHFGSEELRERVGTPVLLGTKRCCLAISDPTAGSDVAGMMATGAPDGNGGFVVNGLKKWITNGTFADYFTTAVRTAPAEKGKPHTGVSLLVVERSPGLTTKLIKTSSSTAAGTSLVVYENVKVPRANLIGEEGKGFAYVMANFNYERWGMVCGGNRHSRLILEECYKWASQRKVFGRTLIAQPVIRNKLAHMSAEVEAVNAFLESVTYQLCQKDRREHEKLAGPIALLKLKQTRVATLVSDEACQIFGGRAVTRTGMGQQVERFQRVYKFHSILGGSEEIMADLGVRQALKYWDHRAKL